MFIDRYYVSPRGQQYMSYDSSRDIPYRFRTGPVDTGGRELEDDEQESLMVWLARAANHPGKMGPYTTPLASTNDPLFWPSHLGVMRAWHAYALLPNTRSRALGQWDWGAKAHGWTTNLNRSSTCYGRNLHDVLPFRGFMDEGRRAGGADNATVFADGVVGDNTAAKAKGKAHRYVEDEVTDPDGAGVSGTPILDSEVDEYFTMDRFEREQTRVAELVADGWTMRGDARYYSNIELMQYFDPKNPRLAHVYDDVSWAHCEGNTVQG